MITLETETADIIRAEMQSIPDKYQKPFNSMHEGLGVLREEYIELENEIFFGEKKAKEDFGKPDRRLKSQNNLILDYKELWRLRVRQEAIQVAAMAARIIQELT